MQQQISHASPAGGGVHPRRREPAQHHGEEKDRQHAQEKAGGAEAQQGQSPRQLSPAGLGLPGRHDTQGDAKENGCRHPRPRQDEGRHHPLGDHGDDGLARAVGEPQVALYQRLEPQDIAQGQGLVQTKISLQRSPNGCAGGFSTPRRISDGGGGHVDQKEDEKGDPEKHRESAQNTFASVV